MILETTDLYAVRKKGVVLDWHLGSRFILWLSCGHSAGMAKAGDMVRNKRCRVCGGMKDIVRVEPWK